MLALVAGMVIWRANLFDIGTRTPANPLASLDARSITAVTIFRAGEPEPLLAERLRQAATAVASLKVAPRIDAGGINWGGATQVRAITTDGLVLWLQLVPTDVGAMARVTADPSPVAKPRAEAIRALRRNAYKLDRVAAAALLSR